MAWHNHQVQALQAAPQGQPQGAPLPNGAAAQQAAGHQQAADAGVEGLVNVVVMPANAGFGEGVEGVQESDDDDAMMEDPLSAALTTTCPCCAWSMPLCGS